LKPNTTGFGGVKPFKPSSAFGASLLESLPPIQGSLPNTPAITGDPTNATGSTAPSAGAFFGAQLPTLGTTSTQPALLGKSPGVGLRPQMTGLGGVNPFRASMAAPGFGTLPTGGGLQSQAGASSLPPPFPGAFGTSMTSASFGLPSMPGGLGAFGAFSPSGGEAFNQQQQSAPSLI